MNTIEMVVIAVVGTGLIAGISLSIYALLPLPWTALESAAQNGRYAGLGSSDPRIDHPKGRRSVTALGSLQGHSA